ncbi:MAG: hypothetical protein GY732_02005 [Gammaproteobacteria bacterium]|nr:hypothetical protein [Gammaproteobacteria bacterium]
MNKHAYLHFLLVIITLVICYGVAGAASVNEAETSPELDNLTNYPRMERFAQGSVQVDFPTLDSWPDFHYLRAWLPVEVSLNTESKRRVGSAYVQATTDINFDQRTVRISDLRVLKTKFADESESTEVSGLVQQAFKSRESIVPLDVLLRLLPENFEIPGQGVSVSRLNFDPPAIVVSEKPLKLLSIDKEPVRVPVQGTDLEYVVNTNWNIFYYRPDAVWYVLNDDAWQRNNYLSDGGWKTTDELPADFDKLALSDSWQDVHKALPARMPSNPPLPFAISLQETELIQLDGAPRLSKIGETGISYVSNTKSDLFRFGDRWYFLVSGRWFDNRELSGRWQSVEDLPDAFSQIPAKHTKAHVLYSVPGTSQARFALIEAALPHRVSVPKGAGADIEVNWIGEPRFEVIDTTQLQRGLNTPYQVIKHNNFYYLCHEGAWYSSDSPAGSWRPALVIPDEIYRIPAIDPAYNVTFVRLDTKQDESRNHVNYNYSSGYQGSFSTTVSVVYGTGWHYPSSVYYDSMNHPYYWHYGMTYGYNIGYHPVGAYYGRRGGYYGRWGGFYGGWGPYGWGGYYPQRTTVTFTSPTQNFNHGYGSAWDGPLQTTPGDPRETSEKSLDEFLPKKKVDGKEAFVKTSKADAAKPAKVSASSLYASTTLSSNRFAGPDGEVYKREGQEWSQYSEGNWDTMRAMQQKQPYEPRPQQKQEKQYYRGYVPAHKKTLSRGELDRQEMARLEGMDNYAKYRIQQDSGK